MQKGKPCEMDLPYLKTISQMLSTSDNYMFIADIHNFAVQGRKGLTESKRLYQTKQHALYKTMPFSNIALASLEIACYATPCS
jgi:hypothetical protein